MKKTLICLLLAASATQSIQAQDRERAVMKGENSVNVYYGVSLLRGVYKGIAQEDALNLKVGGIGPIGFVFEHMVSDKVGLGAELGYGTTTVGWNYESLDFATGNMATYRYDYKFTTIRAQVRANFHMAKSENFDAYFLLSAGYRQNKFTFATTDPTWGNQSVSGLVPFGIKPGFGFRYFFTKNIGLNMELAIGSPVLCGGLSARF